VWSFSSWQSEGSVRLLEVRQRIAAQVDELELRVGSPRGGVEYRPRDLLAVAIAAGASDNDSDPTNDVLAFPIREGEIDFAARHR
jgi:hypothetical protein